MDDAIGGGLDIGRQPRQLGGIHRDRQLAAGDRGGVLADGVGQPGAVQERWAQVLKDAADLADGGGDLLADAAQQLLGYCRIPGGLGVLQCLQAEADPRQ